MKKIIALLTIAFIAAVGYCIYLGVAKSENNNAGMIAMDAGNLAQSVTDTFKDGAVILAAQAKEVAIVAKDEAKSTANDIAQSVSSKAAEIADSAKEGAANAISGVAKQMSEPRSNY